MSWLKIMACVVLAAFMVACSEASVTGDVSDGLETSNDAAPRPVELSDLGKAPELLNEVWLNTPEPLRLEDLRGKVVLLEFWTFG